MYRYKRSNLPRSSPLQATPACRVAHRELRYEPGRLAHCAAQPIPGIAGGQRLQGKHFAPPLRPQGDAIGDGMPQQLIHRALIGTL
jgi:hypothetical protein